MQSHKKKYHFIGIGGIGMSALARILLEQNHQVSGSDLSQNDSTEQLKSFGATVYKGHAAEHINKQDIVIFNSQVTSSNPEFEAAKRLECPILHRSDLLAELMKGTHALAVTGTHGKTTTSSLLAWVLTKAGIDPTFALGGKISGHNGKWGAGQYFVAEADESDGSFLKYYPQGAIITNVEKEHLEHYKTEEAIYAAFTSFFDQVQDPQLLLYCGDDTKLSELSRARGISYGFKNHNLLKIENYRQKGFVSTFDLVFKEEHFSEVTLPLIGKHNALNAAAVFGLCLQLGLEESLIREGFLTFQGVSRRCEKRLEKESILYLDDYAHHPTEIATTLQGIKQAVQERRLIAIFQPHRYTRTRDLFDQFCSCFERADLVIITDIYAAFEETIEGISGEALASALSLRSTVPCYYAPKPILAKSVALKLMPHDVVVTLGAGDITHLHSEFQSFSPKKLKVGLLFGGKSCEHEISLRSVKFVAHALDKALYDIEYFGIDKSGRWIVGPEAEELLLHHKVVEGEGALAICDTKVLKALEECDLFLPILHGTFGEDGTLQGFFELMGKPYAGPNYCSAAICMNKVLTKRLVSTSGLLTPPDVNFSYHQWLEEKEFLLKKIEDELCYPLYIKPIHLGSSVGIHCVHVREELESAIAHAFNFDTHVMVEEGKTNCRELEFAVLGNSQSFKVEAPPPGEKLAQGHFVDYEKKYGTHAIQSTVSPDLAPELIEKGRLLAKAAYEAVGCSGLTRVDFLLDQQGNYWLFEMNSIPGMQALSLFPKIWAREGLNGAQLIDRLIILSLEKHRNQTRHYKCMV